MTVWWLECCLFCFFKQKTAYEMRISDWSSHVCSSDLAVLADGPQDPASRFLGGLRWPQPNQKAKRNQRLHLKCGLRPWLTRPFLQKRRLRRRQGQTIRVARAAPIRRRSAGHTSELQTLIRITYAVFWLLTQTLHNN